MAGWVSCSRNRGARYINHVHTLGSSIDRGLNRVPREGPPTCNGKYSLRVHGAQKVCTRMTALVEPLLRDGLLERNDREGACRLILTDCLRIWEDE
jgi:hypothetical protein